MFTWRPNRSRNFPRLSKRTIKIPPEYAYGKSGAGNIIPSNATLIFEIEVLSVQEPSYKVIDSNQLLSMQDKDLIIIDIRSQKEWKNTGTIIDSIKISAFNEEGNFQSTFLESFQIHTIFSLLGHLQQWDLQ